MARVGPQRHCGGKKKQILSTVIIENWEICGECGMFHSLLSFGSCWNAFFLVSKLQKLVYGLWQYRS